MEDSGLTVATGGMSIEGGASGTLSVNRDPNLTPDHMINVQAHSTVEVFSGTQANAYGFPYTGISAMQADMYVAHSSVYTGSEDGYYEVQISAVAVAGTDMFKWRKCVASTSTCGDFSEDIYIVATQAQDLDEGVAITFGTNAGHQANGGPSGIWTVTVLVTNPVGIYLSLIHI